MHAFHGTTSTSTPEGAAVYDVHLLERRLVRQRVLHKALNQLERGILHLCCRLKLQARSSTLRSALVSIFRKASLWLSPSFLTRVIARGQEIAAANVRAAEMMGLSDARSWAGDFDYLFLLGLNDLSPTMGRAGGWASSHSSA
jgi:hypothetical protein